MRKLIIAGVFLMIVASDWAWTKAPNNSSFIPGQFTAKFVQQYKSKISKKVKSSKGQLDYQYPGNIRFEMKGKTDLIFVSNKTKSWHFTPSQFKDEPAELKISKSSDHNLAHFFDVIKNGLKSNKQYKVTKDNDKYLLSFTDKTAKKINIKKATLEFNSKDLKFKNLKSIELLRKKNKKVKILFSKIETNKTFSSKHFIFTPPTKNVRVTEYPKG